MSMLSKDLHALSMELLKLSQATSQEGDENHEKVYSYYYSKGALDYRDKLLEVLGNVYNTSSAADAYRILLKTYPDPYLIR